MVVIVILGLLLGVVVPNVFKALGGATKDTAPTRCEHRRRDRPLHLENRSLPKILDELTQPSGEDERAVHEEDPGRPVEASRTSTRS